MGLLRYYNENGHRGRWFLHRVQSVQCVSAAVCVYVCLYVAAYVNRYGCDYAVFFTANVSRPPLSRHTTRQTHQYTWRDSRDGESRS